MPDTEAVSAASRAQAETPPEDPHPGRAAGERCHRHLGDTGRSGPSPRCSSHRHHLTEKSGPGLGPSFLAISGERWRPPPQSCNAPPGSLTCEAPPRWLSPQCPLRTKLSRAAQQAAGCCGGSRSGSSRTMSPSTGKQHQAALPCAMLPAPGPHVVSLAGPGPCSQGSTMAVAPEVLLPTLLPPTCWWL